MTPNSPPAGSSDEPVGIRIEHSAGVQVGTGNQQIIHVNSTTVEPPWPVRVGTVPLEADCYQDRDVALTVEQSLDRAGTVVLVPAATTVVAGMGGVGKTQIAAQYVRPLWEDPTVDLAVWITAADRDSITTGYAQAARLVDQTSDEDAAEAARTLLNWLSTTDRQWVIVLDDLQDPDHIKGLWPPHVASGHTIVTTRRHDAALQRADRRLVEVAPYTDAESMAYLRTKLDSRSDLQAGATALARDLGHLPLALAQAVSYVLDEEITCETYRQRFHAGRDVAPDRLPDDHQRTVDRTWELSIALADQLKPVGVARPLLELLSVLDPNGVPAALLTSAPVTNYLEERTGARLTDDDAQRATRCLHRLSLASTDWSQSARAVRVHALVQRAVLSAIPVVDAAVVTVAAADALADIWPDIERDSDFAQSLRANAAELAYRSGPHLWNDGPHAVLFRIGRSLGETGFLSSAVSHFEHLHTAARERIGALHPRTLAARGSLAFWRGEAGDVAGAKLEFERLADEQSRSLGADHHETLTARHNVAYLRGVSGDVAGAVVEFEKLVADRHRVLGADHRDTLVARHNLARWRAESGDVAGAVAEYDRLVDDQVRVLGADHPDTMVTRHNVAYLRGKNGDVAGAIVEFEQLLEDRARVLGDDHPRTLVTRANLLQLWGTSGDVAAAVSEFELLLVDVVRVLGPHHPDTLSHRLTLAHLRGEAGDAAGALIELEGLLVDQTQVLGAEHPGTLTTRYTVAHLRAVVGNIAGALEELEGLLIDQTRVLGADHPDTLSTRSNLARWRGASGDVAGAITENERLLADRLRVLGDDHRDTHATRHNLASLQGANGDVPGAINEYEQMLTHHTSAYGDDHPDTLAIRHNLASLRGIGGDVEGAVADYERLLADVVRIFGADHPRVELTRRALAFFALPADDSER